MGPTTRQLIWPLLYLSLFALVGCDDPRYGTVTSLGNYCVSHAPGGGDNRLSMDGRVELPHDSHLLCASYCRLDLVDPLVPTARVPVLLAVGGASALAPLKREIHPEQLRIVTQEGAKKPLGETVRVSGYRLDETIDDCAPFLVDRIDLAPVSH